MSELDPTDPESPWYYTGLHRGLGHHSSHHRALAEAIDEVGEGSEGPPGPPGPAGFELRGPYTVTFEDVADTFGDTAFGEIDTAVVPLFDVAEGEWIYDIWVRVTTSFGEGTTLGVFTGTDPEMGVFIGPRGGGLDPSIEAGPGPVSTTDADSFLAQTYTPALATADTSISGEYVDYSETPAAPEAGEAEIYALVFPAPGP